ncbi:MAG: phytanoyl-CoA dioxygenase family protein [Alphaproteobacteria bacterium]|nr:phytanoyl-CoA dioxygenase family protein [Alphaproteobacteria bacterium]
MGDLVDSSDLVMDGPALSRRIKRDGYLFVRQLLPRETIADLRRQCLDVIAACGWLRPDTPIESAIAEPGAACVDPDENFVAMLKRLYRLEDLHALKHHAALIGLFERMFGEAVLVHALAIPRAVFPQRPEFTTPAHQDYIHIQGTPETYTVWTPLADCPQALGGLQVAQGSHEDGVRDHRVANGAGAMEVQAPLDGRWVSGDVAAGDILVFHSLTVHKALPNRTESLRQSIDMRYQRASAPVAEVSLTPYAGILTWDEIYAGWTSNRFKYYWKQQNPTIAPFDWQYYERRDRMAFEMAERGEENARPSLLRIIQRDPDPAKRDRARSLVAALDGATAPPSPPAA